MQFVFNGFNQKCLPIVWPFFSLSLPFSVPLLTLIAICYRRYRFSYTQWVLVNTQSSNHRHHKQPILLHREIELETVSKILFENLITTFQRLNCAWEKCLLKKKRRKRLFSRKFHYFSVICKYWIDQSSKMDFLKVWPLAFSTREREKKNQMQ